MYTIVSDKLKQKKPIKEEGNCLIIKSDALVAVNCFFSNFGYICEQRSRYFKEKHLPFTCEHSAEKQCNILF